MREEIVIKGAKENNLKNIDLNIPRNKLVVMTGLSGSGKSTLAFDTIFAEGQRRYVESLSSYARQFLGQLQKPNVESIDGLSPSISIDQKTTSHNPRSTVGTVTEIYDYLRLLFARVGDVHCPKCGEKIAMQTVDQIYDQVVSHGDNSRLLVLAPIARGKKGEFKKEFEKLRKSGYARVKIDGVIFDLDEEINIEKNIKHNIYVVIDRLKISPSIQKRLLESIEAAIKIGEGIVVCEIDDVEYLYSTKYSCPHCGINIEEVEPRIFSFNSPFGACPHCLGIGYMQEIDPELIIPDPTLTLAQGAIKVSGWNLDTGKMSEMYFGALAKKYRFSQRVPWQDLPVSVQQLILYGNGGEELEISYNAYRFTGSMKTAYEGIIPNLERRYRDSTSDYIKKEIEKYMRTSPCKHCGGKRLKKEALAVKIAGLNIYDFCSLSIDKEIEFLSSLQLSASSAIIAKPILKEVKARLSFLQNVGLSYLDLMRSAGTLSGGESQRIRLATQIGSGLTGVLYILDEPSIGLHQRDNEKLIETLCKLRDGGNSLIVVEHDENTMKASDQIIDIGPGAGDNGGEVIFQGTYDEIIKDENSLTGSYLSGSLRIPVPTLRRETTDKFLTITGAKHNNLKNIDVKIPLGVFTSITGVSGSGKSSLINEILAPYLEKNLMRSKVHYGNVESVEGLEHVDKVISIDQSPIGRTPRSNPATYTGVFTAIRDLFANTVDAKERGYKAGRFSFNVKGGRCEHCTGDGIIQIAMHFLPDVYVPCEVCGGKRYNRETLNVLYKGKNINDVLEMRVSAACEFFKHIPSIYNKIKTLEEVGLGYIKLGQSATTLSGGEAQRVKLATELAKRGTGKTVYILDEPTTGLHMADVDKLIKVLQRLCDKGNTIIVIEHDMDIIKVSDYIIDLGPEGGDLGGKIVATGTPEQVAKNKKSYTAKYIAQHLSKSGNKEAL